MSTKWWCNQSCDSPGCVESHWVMATNEAESIELALDDGWVKRGKKLYCPECAPMYWQPEFTKNKEVLS